MTAEFDFSAQAVTPETTREYTFDMIPGAPSIMLAPAHDSNPEYLDARLRLSVEAADKIARQPRGKAPPKTTAADIKAQIEEDREADRKLIAEVCAKGWGTAPTARDGTKPEFSKENALAFVRALPDWMMDALRNFVQNIYNFVDRPVVSDEEADQLGNS